MQPFREGLQAAGVGDDAAASAGRSVAQAREALAQLRAMGYVAEALEVGRQRAKRCHLLRLHSFVVLRLRRSEPGAEPHFLRLDWSAEGLRLQGPAVAPERLSSTGGVLYPLRRCEEALWDPGSALERLDVEVLQPLMAKERKHSLAGFNSGHFVEAVREALVASSLRSGEEFEGLSPEFSASCRLLPELEYLDPVDASGEPLEQWCLRARKETRSGRPLLGRTVEAVPEQAVLGSGAFGRVWRTRDQRSGEMLAVKAVAELDALCEQLAFTRLHDHGHPCIVRLLHFQRFEDAQLCALVMEYCPQGTVYEHIADARSQALDAGCNYSPPDLADRWTCQIFLGLEHLHKTVRIVLRDLKPQNVLLSVEKVAKLADFGLCCPSKGAAPFLDVGGTPGYLAPEIVCGEAHGEKADLYSFGALIWVLYTGGVASRTKPTPPTNLHKSVEGKSSRLSRLRNDWRLLRQQLDSGAMDARARDLALRLTPRPPEERLDHEGIRRHAHLRPLAPPRREATKAALREWLRPPDLAEECGSYSSTQSTPSEVASLHESSAAAGAGSE